MPSARPSADGPIIQAADARAMQAGASLEQVGRGSEHDTGVLMGDERQLRAGGGRPSERTARPIRARAAAHAETLFPAAVQVLALVREASARLRAPLLLFAYHAELLASGGPDSFCRLAGEAGAAGELGRRGSPFVR